MNATNGASTSIKRSFLSKAVSANRNGSSRYLDSRARALLSPQIRPYSGESTSSPSDDVYAPLFKGVPLPAQANSDHAFSSSSDLSSQPRQEPDPVTFTASRYNKQNQPKYARNVSLTRSEQAAFESILSQVYQSSFASSSSTTSPSFAATSDFLTRLRKTRELRARVSGIRLPTEEDELFDRKREEMSFCKDDMELWEWAKRHVFGLSATSTETTTTIGPSSPIYPHLLAYLISQFRDHYSNPHLALHTFHLASRLSPTSYVLGCTTPVYLELLKTKWRCFGDVEGVVEAVEEMRRGGVEIDKRVLDLVREIGDWFFRDGTRAMDAANDFLSKQEGEVDVDSDAYIEIVDSFRKYDRQTYEKVERMNKAVRNIFEAAQVQTRKEKLMRAGWDGKSRQGRVPRGANPFKREPEGQDIPSVAGRERDADARSDVKGTAGAAGTEANESIREPDSSTTTTPTRILPDNYPRPPNPNKVLQPWQIKMAKRLKKHADRKEREESHQVKQRQQQGEREHE